jgi:predicted cupin superfamily sugar epimerase
MSTFAEVRAALNLQPMVVEGGHFNEIYRSSIPSSLPDRCCGTSIYFASTATDVSRWHFVTSDEIWFYHAGSPALQILLFPGGKWERRIIGPDVVRGQVPQSVIPAAVWQAAMLTDRTPDAWGLFGAAVFPGFDYKDYTEKQFSEISVNWPDAVEVVREAGLDL